MKGPRGHDSSMRGFKTREGGTMFCRILIAAAALASLAATAFPARAFDQSRYPDWTGAWRRIPVPGVTGQPGYDQTKKIGPAQQAPLTAEAEAVMKASMADQA